MIVFLAMGSLTSLSTRGGGQEFSEWSWLEGSEGWCGGRDRLLGARDSFSIRGL